MRPDTPIISVLNKKGGVGKTSLTFHLAGELARRGLKVLCVDCDFQANLTAGFLGADRAHALSPAATTAAIACGGGLPFKEDLIRPTGIPGIDLIPGSLAAEEFNASNPATLPVPQQERLREVLIEALGSYDLVLIDCHPDANLLTWGAVLAASHVLIPANPEVFGALGIGPMLALVEKVRKEPCGNPGLAVLGLVINRIGNNANHVAYQGVLREDYGDLVFDATIPNLTAYASAAREQKPVVRYQPKGDAAARMQALADELLVRLAQEVLHG